MQRSVWISLNEIHTMDDEEPVDKHLQNELPPQFAKQIVGGRAMATDNYLNDTRNYSDHEDILSPKPVNKF